MSVDALVARIQPLADKFARELAEIVAAKVDQMIGKVAGAFESAVSIAAADLMAETITGNDGNTPQKGPRPQTLSRTAARAVPTHPKRGRAPAKVPGQKTCGKCGKVGANSRGCGISHEPQAAARDESDDEDPEPESTPEIKPKPAPEPRPRRPRLRSPEITAEIEDEEPRRARVRRVQQARSGKPPELGMRGPRVERMIEVDIVDTPPDDQEDELDEYGRPPRWPRSVIEARASEAEASKHLGVVPMPRSSFLLVRTDQRLASVAEVSVGLASPGGSRLSLV